jgi:hypothetical protein
MATMAVLAEVLQDLDLLELEQLVKELRVESDHQTLQQAAVVAIFLLEKMEPLWLAEMVELVFSHQLVDSHSFMQEVVVVEQAQLKA